MAEELDFRRELSKAMRHLWVLTWHEDREINPGVPDISYVIPDCHHETGWLELKAIKPPLHDNYRFKIEPSQHRWIERHHMYVPVHFLLAAGDYVWFIAGKHHTQLLAPLNKRDLCDLGKMFPREDLCMSVYAAISEATLREYKK